MNKIDKTELKTNYHKSGFYLRKLYPPKNIILNNKEKLVLSALYYLNRTDFYELDYKKLMRLLPFRKKEIEDIINDLLEKKCLYDDRGEIGLNSDMISLADNYPNIMFIELEIIKDKALSFNNRLILCYLKSYCDKYNSCVSTSETISKILDINEKTVQRALKRFQTLGILNITENDNSDFDVKTKIELDNKKVYDLYDQFKKKKVSLYSISRYVHNETTNIEKQINNVDNSINTTNNINNNIDNSKNTNITQNITNNNQTLTIDKETLKNAIKELADENNLSIKEILTSLLRGMIEKG